MSRDLFIFAGEASGDLHGEQLIKKLKKKRPELDIFGVGGPLMRRAGLAPLLPMEAFEVMGFVDVFLALPRLMRQFFQLRRAILKENPKAVLLIDYPGFNLALAKSLSKRGFKGKICQYICPTVWAWNKKRIPKMEKSLDHLFAILPFEPPLFDPTKLAAEFVGHPLMHRPRTATAVSVPQGKRAVAIFPGSRAKEIERNLSLQLETAQKLLEEFPNLFFLISVAKPSFTPIIQKKVEELSLPALLEEDTYGIMASAECAIATSGTITLELALHKVPTVVTYGISALDLFIARRLLRIRLTHYCLVNILAQGTLFPELIGPNLTFKNLLHEMRQLLSSEKRHYQCREKCQEIAILLGEKEPEVEILGVLEKFL
jgi:lipid-A-disaccharide synthase